MDVFAKLLKHTSFSNTVKDAGSGRKRGLTGDIINAFPKLLPLVLSHHPDCEPYRADVIRIGKLRLCRGCTIAYGLVVLIFGSYLLFGELRDLFGEVPPPLLILSGAALGMFQVLRAVFRRMGIPRKTLVKLALGSGIALVLIGIMELDLGRTGTIWLMVGLFLLYGTLGGYIRYVYMKRTCLECEYGGDMRSCPGMSVVRELD